MIIILKFYSKNVGYIADEDGRLYKTINGGISWEFLTPQYGGMNSIELVDDNVFTAGSNGRIYKSDVEYDPIVLHVNPDLDCIASAYLAISYLTKGKFPSNTEALTNYVDDVDTGLWNSIDKAKLIVPIDVHMGRLCKILGFYDRKTVSLKAAIEITEAFVEIEPGDPAKYDFSLSRIGIVENCSGKVNDKCQACELKGFCIKK